MVEHTDRFVRFGAEYVEAAPSASGRRLPVVDPTEADDDLVVTWQRSSDRCARARTDGGVPPAGETRRRDRPNGLSRPFLAGVSCGYHGNRRSQLT